MDDVSEQPEILSSGPPPRRHRRATIVAGVLLACLVAAFLVARLTDGGRTVPGPAPGTSDGTSAGGLSVGGLSVGALARTGHPLDRTGFELKVFNAGRDPVEVAVLGLPGWTAEVRGEPTTLRADSWGVLRFTTEADCTTVPAPVRSATVAVGAVETELDAPGAGRVLAAYHAAACSKRTPIGSQALIGSWLIEEVYGEWRRFEGAHVVRFAPGGVLMADPAGVRFTGRQGVEGRYHLKDGRLTTQATMSEGQACLPGRRAVWRADVLPDGRLRVELEHSDGCPNAVGEVWIARRTER